MRQEWLLGFGWDQHIFADNFKPHRKVLDELYPSIPVAFTRVDAHSFWVSTEALKRAGLYSQNIPSPEGGHIELDEQGWPTGLLTDLAYEPVRGLIPVDDAYQIRRNLLSAIQMFNGVGITHIRDMSCDEQQWNESCYLAEQKDFTLAVVQNFGAETPDKFNKALELAVRARKQHPRLIRPGAIKIYFDGALGSEGAKISRPYSSGSGSGFVLFERIALKEMIQRTWSLGLDIAVHTIGDEAADIVATVAHELWEMGEVGRLHLEHVELLRPDTIIKLKNQNVVCHMQPSHWLADKPWLEEKIGDLIQYAFPWGALDEAGIQFFFGSDSPISDPGLTPSIEALADAEKNGIRSPSRPVSFYHSFPDKDWTPNTYTMLKENKLENVFFDGNKII